MQRQFRSRSSRAPPHAARTAGRDPLPDLLLRRTWGFCLPTAVARVSSRATTTSSSTRASNQGTSPTRALLEGAGDGEVLISTYVCHPSLANDNLSGIVVATMLAKELMERRFDTRTASSSPRDDRPARMAAQNQDRLDRSPRADALVHRRWREPDLQAQPASRCRGRPGGGDRFARLGDAHRVLDWEPWGGDERQFCSPGFDLPVGSLMRTPHGEFEGYHTSADGLDRIRRESLRKRLMLVSTLLMCSRQTAGART